MITGVQKAAKQPAYSAASAAKPSAQKVEKSAWKPVSAASSKENVAPVAEDYVPKMTQESEDLLTKFKEANSQEEHKTALELFEQALGGKKSREPAFACLYYLAQEPAVFAKFEPYLVALLPTMLEHLADKQTPVRECALEGLQAMVSSINVHAVANAVPALFEGLQEERKWQTKTGSLALLSTITKAVPAEATRLIPQIVPHVSNTMWDTKNEVKAAAKSVMLELCKLVGNPDIEAVVPEIVDSISNPERVPEVIKLLGLTTFVWRVEAPTLTIMVPLLVRSLNERSIPLRRKTGLIIDAMCRLVDDPEIVAPFLPTLLPCLKKVEEQTSDPDCLEVLQEAHETLRRVGAISAATEDDVKAPDAAQRLEDQMKSMIASLKPLIGAVTFVPQYYDVVIAYVASICNVLVNDKNFDQAEWKKSIVPYISTCILAADAEKVCEAFLSKCLEIYDANEESDEDDEGGEDLCNCRFGLAYGSKILLYRTTLHLIRGRRYGLCGPNGAGKSTLMRAIANGQVEGFPSADVVRTVYVEHDIDGSEADTSVVDFVVEALTGLATREEVTETLVSVGFSDHGLAIPINALSGGWKMKLALARAMLMKADIFLLDEPTNHLDSVNVAWLEDYLTKKCPRVTSIIVSHDSGFLDNVCTDIIHYNKFQLKRYKGTLSEFVEKVPAARSYYDLVSATQKYTFPKPGLLDGVKTQEKAILRMRNVSFTYPGADKKQLEDVSVQCSLGSRVAVLGPNGAGKSTLIKMMTGETSPDEGTLWKHPNLRIAYVAQHAFHHIEQHLDTTPNAYIQWRFANGEDIEEQEKVHRKISEEDVERMKQSHMRPDGKAKVVDQLLGRQKYKNSFQYEVSWVGYVSTGKHKQTTWLPRETLEEMGLTPKLIEFDSKYAAEQSYSRPLNLKEVEKHLISFGLMPEFGTHAMIRGLSGGQKVRLVIAAAMWNRPHMLILDEPTNFLDRDSVAALAAAIKEFQGGVVMITHNQQFYKALTDEIWHVQNGRLSPEGNKWGSTRNLALEEREKLERAHAEEETATDEYKVKETKIKVGKAGGRKAKKDLERKKKLNHGVLIVKEHVTGEALTSDKLGHAKRSD